MDGCHSTLHEPLRCITPRNTRIMKLIVSLVVKFPAFYGTQIFITVFTKAHIFENVVLLGYDAAIIANFLRTFRDNLAVPSSGVKN